MVVAENSAIAYALIPVISDAYISICNQPIFKHRSVEHIANTVHAATDILNHGVEAAKGITVDRGTR